MSTFRHNSSSERQSQSKSLTETLPLSLNDYFARLDLPSEVRKQFLNRWKIGKTARKALESHQDKGHRYLLECWRNPNGSYSLSVRVITREGKVLVSRFGLNNRVGILSYGTKYPQDQRPLSEGWQAFLLREQEYVRQAEPDFLNVA